ncbi:hypothetical protein KC959_01770 [Candidatus Saccharibacteria bacterium]|nr:hypothetical protein [Candidatus Saccharibacteria bacterium]
MLFHTSLHLPPAAVPDRDGASRVMRQPNYRIGWYIPHQLAALTHFHPEVTNEDFMGVLHEGQALFESVKDAFSIIIDNRVVAMSAPVSLSQMRQVVPYMHHPLLRWVIVIKPEELALDTTNLPIETEGTVHLKNVSSLAEALSYLQQVTSNIQWHLADETFFSNILSA